ncbi:MAG: hypothetical protein ACTH3O_07855 [Brevibacterium aurantiacum]
MTVTLMMRTAIMPQANHRYNRPTWSLSTDHSRITAMPISTQFMAVKTSRPMPRPSGIVMPGAVNFSGASISEMPMMRPSQMAGSMTRAPAESRVS